MSDPVYVAKVRIERVQGSLRRAFVPAEPAPVLLGVHDEVAAHYGRKPGEFEPHATTLDYVIAAAAG